MVSPVIITKKYLLPLSEYEDILALYLSKLNREVGSFISPASTLILI